MQWKLWRREKSNRGAAKDAETDDGILQLSSLMSSREILGLQRIIGNQAVLQMMSRQGSDALRSPTQRN